MRFNHGNYVVFFSSLGGGGGGGGFKSQRCLNFYFYFCNNLFVSLVYFFAFVININHIK